MTPDLCRDAVSTCDKVKEIRPWTTEELKAFRDLAKWSMEHWPTLYKVFATTTRHLARKGLQIGYDWKKLQAFEENLAATSASGAYSKAALDMAEYLAAEIKAHTPELLGDPKVARFITELSDFRTQQSAPGSASIHGR